MNVGELKELLEGLDDYTEIRGAEYGYRSSGYYYIEEAQVVRDIRKYDDWGNEKEPLGDVLVITVGDTADNRYPPSDEEIAKCWECDSLFDTSEEGDEGRCGDCTEAAYENEEVEV